MDLQTYKIENSIRRDVSVQMAKREKPNEIPQPGRSPETVPAQEPEPSVWPRKEPEIKPEKEPLTVPPTAPPEVPEPPMS